MERPLYIGIWRKLAASKAMVFISGPRQSGKTTLARSLEATFSSHLTVNWDLVTDKRLIQANPTFFEDIPRKDSSAPLIVFDEIHKYRRWKNYLKGLYDGYADRYRFLVLGSGRLNMFQKGGDSMAGRYYLMNLFPFTLGELSDQRRSFQEFLDNPLNVGDEKSSAQSSWETLAALSGFPEPFLSNDHTLYRRWSNSYHSQLVREDIRNATMIKNIDDVEILLSLLPTRVGSMLSIDNLARDIQVAHHSVQTWLDLFESFFLVFRLKPWTKRVSRGIQKKKKLYLYDYGGIPSPPAKFENMVALELLRGVTNWNDLGLGTFSLHYIRNKEKEEVDFLIVNNRSPFLLVETKLDNDQIPVSLRKFQSLLDIPAVLLVNKPGISQFYSNGKRDILAVSATRWLAGLP